MWLVMLLCIGSAARAQTFELLVLMHDSGRVERYDLKTGEHVGTLISGLPASNAILFEFCTLFEG